MQNIATTANVELLADVASDCTDAVQRAVFVEATCALDSYVDTGRVLEFHERLLFKALIEQARQLRASQQQEKPQKPMTWSDRPPRGSKKAIREMLHGD